MAEEDYDHSLKKIDISIAPGLGMASEKNNSMYREILDEYSNRNFVNKDGSLNLTTVVDIVTNIFVNHGFDKHIEGNQFVNGIHIYQPDYFCPLNMYTGLLNITTNTYAIHKYDGSWATSLDNYMNKARWYCCNKFGIKLGMKVYKLPVYVYQIKTDGFLVFMKLKIKKWCGYDN